MFTGEEVFQSLLSRFGIGQVVATDLIDSNLRWKFGEELNNGLNYISKKDEVVLLPAPFIALAKDAIYTDDPELAKNIEQKIGEHVDNFQELLNNGLAKLHTRPIFTGS